MQPGKPITDSRWQKPNLYITIVAIYLLVLASVTLYFVMGTYYSQQTTSDTNEGYGRPSAGWLFVVIFILPLSTSLSALSVAGANLMLFRKKIGTIISLAAMILWTISLSVFTLMMVGGGSFGYDAADSLSHITWISFLVSNPIMYVFLIKGRKQVQWK